MTAKTKKTEPPELVLDAKALAQVEKFNGESNAIATLRDSILRGLPELLEGLAPEGIAEALQQAENLRQAALRADLMELALLEKLPGVLKGLRDSARQNEASANEATGTAFEGAKKTFEAQGFEGFQLANHADRAPKVLEARAEASRWSRIAAKFAAPADHAGRLAELRDRVKAAIVPSMADPGKAVKINL